MASAFNVELTMREAPAEAQARAATDLAEPARTLGLRLANRGTDELAYKPPIRFPLLLMVYRRLSGERMTVRFEPDPSGGSRVSISGAVAKSKLPVATDPEHWTDALGSTAGG